MDKFNARRNLLFASLDDASKEIEGTSLDQKNNNNSNPKKGRTIKKKSTVHQSQRDGMLNNRSLSHFCGKESIFKKPERPIGRCLKPRIFPDYELNPLKWKKYSLADVDISEQTNTAAALNFLNEMNIKLENQQEYHSANNTADNLNPQKIDFKKSIKIVRQMKAIEEDEVADVEVDKPKLRDFKLLMPEYVVGCKQPAVRKPKISDILQQKCQKKQRRATCGALKLSHLENDGDVEDVEGKTDH